MFYVLDFHSHRFTTCETVEEVNEKLKQLQAFRCCRGRNLRHQSTGR